MTDQPADPRLRLSDADKERLQIMFLAKHAKGDGTPHPIDGKHATYHHELAQTLREIGLNLTIGTTFEDLIDAPKMDYLFTLLNRAGFKNSEMLAPTISVWRGYPHLGGSPIIRGIGDDKHLTKHCARARGVNTPAGEIYRLGSDMADPPSFPWTKLVVKPNASSASWGVKMVDSWEEAQDHMAWLFDEGGHDVIVESFFDGIELAVPVVPGANKRPVFLPVMKYTSDDNDRLRTYEEKRGLVPTTEGFSPFHEPEMTGLVIGEVRKMMPEIWPFDYGRFEFKVNPETMESSFIEVNMSCNLWSRKTLSLSWQSLGYTHRELVETILVGSLLRQGVIDAPA
ncbi:MAG: phosphoribosylglycinamide synthetase [Pseudomonadota bacterium]